MKNIYLLIVICLLGFSPLSKVFATQHTNKETQQQVTVTGRVTDAEGSPLTGVSVIVKGTTTGVFTNVDGKYSTKADNQDAVLQFTFVGMKSQEVAIRGKSVIDIVMEDNTVQLDEIVTIGYGSIRKEEITSSVARISSEDFVDGMVTTPLQLLQGKVAGLGISHTSGNPVSGNVDIMLRGVSTLAASAAPLIVIDGIPGGTLNAISAEDIESISILKDGSAAAIYGTQGTNGVILITTKNPEGGKTSVEYQGYISTEFIRRTVDVLDADDVRMLKQYKKFSAINDYGASTDWVDEITRTPISHVHNLSIRGGGANTNYIASITYRDHKGVIEETGKKSLVTRLRINHSMFEDKLRIVLNLNNNIVTDHQVAGDVFANAVLRNPTLPIYNEDGSYREVMNTGVNPVGLINEGKGSNKYDQLMMNGKISLRPIEDLDLSAMFAYQGDFNLYNFNTSHKSYAATMGGKNGEVFLNGGHGEDRISELQGNYTKKIKDHTFNGMLGYSYNDYTYESWSMDANDFPLDVFGSWNIGSANSIKDGLAHMSSNKYSWKLIAFFGRLNYNYANKYLFMASLRREGSSKFGKNNKWGYFPAVSAGWRVTNEPFMKNVKFLNDLKLRVGYGITGTSPTSAYHSLTRYQFNTSMAMYNDGKWINALVPSSNPNPDLKWEKKKEFNIGIDYSMFSDRFSGSIDFYHRKTNDLLYTYSVPVPPNIYETIFANVGSIKNQGVEFVGTVNIFNKKDFSWSITGNVSYNKNELVSLSGDKYKRDYLNLGDTGAPMQQYTHRIETGKPLGNFYAWQVEGLKNGGTEWQVVGAGDDTPGEEHKRVVGNGMPKVFSGLTTNLRYKDFDLTIALRGVFGFDILNQYRMERETLSWLATYNLPVSAFEKPFGGEDYNFAPSIYSDYYVEKGDYVKLDNVTLGHSFKIKNQPYLKKARVYVSGLNLMTFTKYKGMDPEIAISGTTPGVDWLRNYPSTCSFILGLNLTF
jgi:TonB-linked SusC/RagA family outer membrane protein